MQTQNKLKQYWVTYCIGLCIGWFGISLAIAEVDDGIDIALPDDLDVLLSDVQQQPYSFNSYLKNETSYRFDEPRSFTKIKNLFWFSGQYEFNEKIKFFASGLAYYDAVYDAFEPETIAARANRDEQEPLVFVERLTDELETDRSGNELREFYLDIFLSNLDIRLGRQHAVWGVLEGIRIVDEINPMDFRELILPDLFDYRIPLWMAKLDYYYDNAIYELLWIPELKFHQDASPGSEWEFFQVLDTTTAPDNFKLKFSEIGFKFSKTIWDTEIALSYFYTWDDYPSTFRVLSRTEIQRSTPGSDLAIFPTYTRLGMYGATLTKALHGDILKAEFAYVTGKYFATDDVFDEDGYLRDDGELKRNHIRWGVGYDFSLWGADFSPAITQWIILNYNKDVLSDQFDTGFNLFVRKPLLRHSAVFTLLLIRLINFQETYFKPKVVFNLTDRFLVATGFDIFIGQRTQFGRAASANDPGGLVDLGQRARFLGNFRDNRRLFVEFKYNF